VYFCVIEFRVVSRLQLWERRSGRAQHPRPALPVLHVSDSFVFIRSPSASPHRVAFRVRVSTWNRLNLLKAGALSSALRQALTFDPIRPVLAEPHLAALDRRLSGVMATVKQCMEAQSPDGTLIEDRMNLPHP